MLLSAADVKSSSGPISSPACCSIETAFGKGSMSVSLLYRRGLNGNCCETVCSSAWQLALS